MSNSHALHKSVENTILFGADMEISHFHYAPADSTARVSTDLLLLNQLRGVPAHAKARRGRGSPLDVGRRYDPRNGSCYYSELGHLEVCTPLCAGPSELVVYIEACRQRVRETLNSCNKSLEDGSRIVAMFESRCGRDRDAVSIGTHINYLIDYRTWVRICSGQFPAITGFVASAVAGIQLIAGLGCIGAANRRPRVDYQISQRSDFITRLACLDTMGRHGRGLINTRDEPECGPDNSSKNPFARFHHICLDVPLSEHALFATVGMVALVLAAVSEDLVSPDLILADPVTTFWQWSHDPSLSMRAALADGTPVTSCDYLARLVNFLHDATKRRELSGYVPESARVLDFATSLSDAFCKRDWHLLGRRIDWVCKRQILAHAITNLPMMDWESPQVAIMDQLYGSADPEESLYCAQRNAGEIDRLISDSDLQHALENPPENTRSWGHTMLLRRIASDPDIAPVRVNWDEISIRGRERTVNTVWFTDPRSHTRADCEQAFAYESNDEAIRTLTSNGNSLIRPHGAADSVDRGNTYKLAAEGREL